MRMRFGRSACIRSVKILGQGGSLIAIGRIGLLHVAEVRAQLGFVKRSLAPFPLQR